MSRHYLVSAQTSNVCITCHTALNAIGYIVSNNLWCHFQQFPWGIGSVGAERVGQGEVGWYIHPKGENRVAVCGFSCKIPQ